MSKLTLLYTHGLITTCLNFLAFYQIIMDVENEVPPHKDAQEVCVWCRVLELISPLYGMYIDKTVKYYTTHLMLTAELL